MSKGQYVRLSAEDIARRDKELKEAGVFPKNPKRRAAAYVKLQELKAHGTAPSPKGKKNGKAATPKQARPHPIFKPTKAVAPAKKTPKTPPKLRERAPKMVAPASMGAPDYELQNRMREVRAEFEFACMCRGNLGQHASTDQATRLSALIDWSLTRYQTLLQELYPAPEPVVEPEPADVSEETAASDEESTDCGGEDCGGGDEPEAPEPSARVQMPLSSLPTPPPAPAIPPPINKPPTMP